ncbi:MAG: hypothetical protein JKY89_06030 [Immundisolibacteraceae bacterium]|nr:hypothetical protein [Immundisolibacteraceae bacterium]
MDESTVSELDKLCKIDANIIALAFTVSDDLGVEAIKGAVIMFKSYLRENNPDFVPSLDIKYRYYITTMMSMTYDKLECDTKRGLLVQTVLFGRQ